MDPTRHTPSIPIRRGLITPLVALSLVAVLGATALVLDRLWLDAARAELTAAAEAAALAAAGDVAGDDALRDDADWPSRLDASRRAAAQAAGENLAAGQRVELDASAGGDIRFGRLLTEDGQTRFLEVETEPTSVVVTARRTRSRNNPVALFLSGTTGQPEGDVWARAEATLDGRVIGIRPLSHAPVPALPLAVLQLDGTGQRQSWEAQIEQRLGADTYGIDVDSGEVQSGGDGIPEIVLKSDTGDNDEEINLRLLDLGDGPTTQQILRGWTAEDLEEFDGELRFDHGGQSIEGTPTIAGDVAADLEEVIGEPRIVLLYSDVTGAGQVDRVHCVGLVAARIMAIRPVDSGYEIVLQPTVLTTRTAVVGETDQPNRYVHKLQLTH